MLFVKKYGKCPQDPVGMEVIFSYTKEVMKIIWRKKRQGWKVKQPVLIRQKIPIVKNWSGCVNNQGQEQPKAKVARIIFMKLKKRQNNGSMIRKCNCKRR